MIRTFLLLIGLSLSFASKAQMKEVKGKSHYDFVINLPEEYSSTGESQPLILFLHGRSLSGSNLNRVKRYGVLYAQNKGVEISGMVVAPQTTNGWSPDKVIEVLDYVIANYNVDMKRIYICGMSMGGYGTMHVVGKYPERFAAAVAICGGGSVADACNLAKIPLWIQHGSNDRAVPASESKKIYNAIKRCDPNADAKLTIIKGGTHGSVESLFHRDELYDWLLSHSIGE